MSQNKVFYSLLQKIYRQPLKKITHLATRPSFLAQGQRFGWPGLGLHEEDQDLGLQGQGQNFSLKAKAIHPWVSHHVSHMILVTVWHIKVRGMLVEYRYVYLFVCVHASPIKLYHAVCWGISAIISVVGLFFVYYPSLLRYITLSLMC